MLARIVSDKMGGHVRNLNLSKKYHTYIGVNYECLQVSREDMINFPFKLHIAKLKTDLKTNVIPIGLIKQGTFYHR